MNIFVAKPPSGTLEGSACPGTAGSVACPQVHSGHEDGGNVMKDEQESTCLCFTSVGPRGPRCCGHILVPTGTVRVTTTLTQCGHVEKHLSWDFCPESPPGLSWNAF